MDRGLDRHRQDQHPDSPLRELAMEVQERGTGIAPHLASQQRVHRRTVEEPAVASPAPWYHLLVARAQDSGQEELHRRQELLHNPGLLLQAVLEANHGVEEGAVLSEFAEGLEIRLQQ